MLVVFCSSEFIALIIPNVAVVFTNLCLDITTFDVW